MLKQTKNEFEMMSDCRRLFEIQILELQILANRHDNLQITASNRRIIHQTLVTSNWFELHSAS